LSDIAPVTNSVSCVGRPGTHVVENQAQLNSAWKIFGVAPRSWPNSTTTADIAAASVARRKYQRTSLWWLYPFSACSPMSSVLRQFCGWLKRPRVWHNPTV